MFTREARLAALLQHPNIVQIFDYGKIEMAYFIAMEYINGKNLKEILTALKQGLPIEHTVFIFAKYARDWIIPTTGAMTTPVIPLKLSIAISVPRTC